MRVTIGALAFLCVLTVLPAARLLAQTPAVPPEEFPVFRELERLALSEHEPKARRLSAIGALASAAHPSVTPALLVLLANPDPELRSAAALALGWAGNRAAIDSLVPRALDPAEDNRVRVMATRALGRIGDPTAVSTAQALARDPDVGVRREALLVLTESPLAAHADRVSAAITLVGDAEQDGHVRSRAAVLLGSSKDPRAFEPLIKVLQDVQPVASLPTLPAPDRLTGQTKILAQRLRSLHDVRAHAAYALGELRNQEAGPALLRSLSDADPIVRLRSAAALGRLRAPGAVPGLIEASHDPDTRVREAAVTALGDLCDPAAGPTLRTAIDDKDAGVRGRAAFSLARLGDQAVRGDLVKVAEEDPVPAVRDVARRALRRLERGKSCQ